MKVEIAARTTITYTIVNHLHSHCDIFMHIFLTTLCEY